jgi:hypothetical protein
MICSPCSSLVVDSGKNKTVYYEEELFMSHKAKISGSERIAAIEKQMTRVVTQTFEKACYNPLWFPYWRY